MNKDRYSVSPTPPDGRPTVPAPTPPPGPARQQESEGTTPPIKPKYGDENLVAFARGKREGIEEERLRAESEGVVVCAGCGTEAYSMATGEKIPQGPKKWRCSDCEGVVVEIELAPYGWYALWKDGKKLEGDLKIDPGTYRLIRIQDGGEHNPGPQGG